MLRFIITFALLAAPAAANMVTLEQMQRPPLSPAQKEFLEQQATREAIAARSPEGFVILSFKRGLNGEFLVTLGNITGSTATLDGTKLRVLDYWSGRVYQGESTSGFSFPAGASRQLALRFVGNPSGMVALQWAGTEVWTDYSGRTFRTSGEIIAQARPEAQRAKRMKRKPLIIPVDSIREGPLYQTGW